MTITVATIYEHARDQHPALSKANAPELLAPRFCTRLQCALYDEIWRRVPGFLAKKVTFTMPLSVFTDGVVLDTLIPGGWKDLLELRFFRPDTGVPQLGTGSRFMPFEQRDMAGRTPSHTFRDGTLYLLGGPNDYSAYTSAELIYTAQPADLTLMTDAITLPPDALETFAYGLAAFYIRRLIGDPQYRVPREAWQVVDSEAKDERKEFLSRIFRFTQRQEYAVRDVT